MKKFQIYFISFASQLGLDFPLPPQRLGLVVPILQNKLMIESRYPEAVVDSWLKVYSGVPELVILAVALTL